MLEWWDRMGVKKQLIWCSVGMAASIALVIIGLLGCSTLPPANEAITEVGEVSGDLLQTITQKTGLGGWVVIRIFGATLSFLMSGYFWGWLTPNVKVLWQKILIAAIATFLSVGLPVILLKVNGGVV